MKLITAAVLVLLLATSVSAVEKKAFTMRDDFGTEPLYDCALQYYYYIPCPTSSWFWSFYGWTYGDRVGTFFLVGDVSMGGWNECDPYLCFLIETIRVLDFAGYGTVYPGLFTVQFDIYCSDEDGCPIGPAVWTSGPYETGFAWNYVNLDPPWCVPDCATQAHDGLAYPRFLVTATHIGTNCAYPQWGFDNISTPLEVGCEFHDMGCLTALYPRPYTSHYSMIHSGYYGVNFEYCPPEWFCDGQDTSATCDQYGFIELAWRLYLSCIGPTASEPSTWGNIKSMYR